MSGTLRNDDTLDRERAYFSGQLLYGDDLTGQELVDWITSEENGYHDVRKRQGKYSYGYHAINRFTGTAG